MYTRNPKIIEKIFDNVLFLINFDSEDRFQMNKIGAFIWHNIEEKSIDDIIAELVANYDQNKESIQKDVMNYIDLLIQNDLIIKEG